MLNNMYDNMFKFFIFICVKYVKENRHISNDGNFYADFRYYLIMYSLQIEFLTNIVTNLHSVASYLCKSCLIMHISWLNFNLNSQIL